MYPIRFALQFILFCSAIVLVACQKSESKDIFSKNEAPSSTFDDSQTEAAPEAFQTSRQATDSVAQMAHFSSLAARMIDYDFGKRWVREASIKFQVNNATEATLMIEDIVAKQGGFVTNSHLVATNIWNKTQPFRADSAYEARHFQMEGNLNIRVPNTNLEATLREIGRLAVFLDHRTVSAEDVGLQLLEQTLTTLREQQFQENLTEETPNKAAPKAERGRNSQKMADLARLNTLKLEDKIQFSTVSVHFYQTPQVLINAVAQDNPAAIAPSFAWRLGKSIRAGGAFLVEMILVLFQLWGVFLVGFLAFWAWKWWQIWPKHGKT